MRQGCKFEENQRIYSRHNSRNIQVWESISLIELCTRCLSVYYIWFSQATMNLHPCAYHGKVTIVVHTASWQMLQYQYQSVPPGIILGEKLVTLLKSLVVKAILINIFVLQNQKLKGRRRKPLMHQRVYCIVIFNLLCTLSFNSIQNVQWKCHPNPVHWYQFCCFCIDTHVQKCPEHTSMLLVLFPGPGPNLPTPDITQKETLFWGKTSLPKKLNNLNFRKTTWTQDLHRYVFLNDLLVCFFMIFTYMILTGSHAHFPITPILSSPSMRTSNVWPGPPTNAFMIDEWLIDWYTRPDPICSPHYSPTCPVLATLMPHISLPRPWYGISSLPLLRPARWSRIVLGLACPLSFLTATPSSVPVQCQCDRARLLWAWAVCPVCHTIFLAHYALFHHPRLFIFILIINFKFTYNQACRSFHY